VWVLQLTKLELYPWLYIQERHAELDFCPWAIMWLRSLAMPNFSAMCLCSAAEALYISSVNQAGFPTNPSCSVPSE